MGWTPPPMALNKEDTILHWIKQPLAFNKVYISKALAILIVWKWLRESILIKTKIMTSFWFKINLTVNKNKKGILVEKLQDPCREIKIDESYLNMTWLVYKVMKIQIKSLLMSLTTITVTGRLFYKLIAGRKIFSYNWHENNVILFVLQLKYLNINF